MLRLVDHLVTALVRDDFPLASTWQEAGGLLVETLTYRTDSSRRAIVLQSLPTSEAFIAVALATWKAGFVGSAAGVRASTREVELSVRRLQPQIIVRTQSDDRFLSYERADNAAHFELAGLPVVVASTRFQHDHALAPEDAWLAATSGSTGDPKYAILTESNLEHNATQVAAMQELTARDVVCVFTPASFSYALNQSLAAMMAGARVIFWSHGLAAPSSLLGFIERHGVTALSANPTTFILLLKGRPNQYPNMRAIVSGGQELTPGTLALLREHFPAATIYSAYGATENVNRISYQRIGPTDPLPRGPIHVGKAIPGVNLRISDARNGIGEVIVSGRSLMRGYLGQLAEADRVHEFRTGDLGVIDADGNLSIVGRIKAQINVGNEMISPEEVESVSSAVQGISECAVGSRRHSLLGEAPVILVSLEPGLSQGSVCEMLRDVWAKTLSRIKWPVEIYVVPQGQIPRTQYGKIDRRELNKTIKLLHEN